MTDFVVSSPTMKRFSLFLLFYLFLSKITFAQKNNADKKTESDSSGVINSVLFPTIAPLLLFDEAKEKEEKKEKKKKARKNVWFGIKTMKGGTRRSIRGQEYLEFFHYTDAERKPNPYIRDVYWFDPKEKAIRTEGFVQGQGYLLHGPYERLVNETVVESGMFFYGMKHKTWMVFDDRSVLLDKAHFSEGWPKESKISYFDESSRAIEKMIPIQYGLEEGNFFHFYENQQIAVTGEYRFGEKVGLWTEYWDTKNTKAIRKREIQYQEKPFTKEFRPYIRAEWDKDGNLIYRREN
jgi:hypothetical protein